MDDVGDVYKQFERAAHDFLAAAAAVDKVVKKAKDLKRRADAEGCNISTRGRVFIPDDRVPEEKADETLEGELIMREAAAIVNALELAYKVIEVMHPDWVGNLGGVPFNVRDRANRRRIDPMLSDINKRIAKLEKEINDKANDPKSRGGTYDPDKESELRILEEKRRDLLSVKRKFGGAPDGTHSLVSLDAFKGDHLWAAVGSGDIDNADHVMVHTPGMTATVESHLMGKGKGWGSGVSGVDNVLDSGRHQLQRQHRHEQVAGITVLNYDAPRWGEVVTPQHSVTGDHQVEVGGKSGADMLYAVQATHSGDPHLVASGHSYGSSATGWALQHSTVVDDAMFSGSPGVTTMNNEDLNMLPGHTNLGEAAWDWVADAGRFGGDPSFSKEFNQWSCDDWTAPDGTGYKYSEGHSEYMNKGYTSTYNQGSILIGDGVAVKDD